MYKIQIGLLGLGTVGSGVVEIIRKQQSQWIEKYGCMVEIKKILVRNLAKERQVADVQKQLTTNPNEIFEDPEIQIVVEVMGGEEPTLSYVQQGLEKGKHLVTANKLLLALHGPELFQQARKLGLGIGFEASVGGGIPLIEPLLNSLTANTIESVQGILNGTTNYILTAMEENQEDYFAVLKKAQALGYAEADPASDVEGWDACYKLSVLTGVVFGEQVPPARILTQGIQKIHLNELAIAHKLGYSIKLLATATKENSGITAYVHPTLLPKTHPLARVQGVNNALFVQGDAVGEVCFSGPGAGKLATGSAVCADLLQLCRILTANHQQRVQMSRKIPDGLNSLPRPEKVDKNIALAKRSQFFLTVETSRANQSELIAGIAKQAPIRELITESTGNCYITGILLGKIALKELQRLIKEQCQFTDCRRLNYYFVEGSES